MDKAAWWVTAQEVTKVSDMLSNGTATTITNW